MSRPSAASELRSRPRIAPRSSTRHSFRTLAALSVALVVAAMVSSPATDIGSASLAASTGPASAGSVIGHSAPAPALLPESSLLDPASALAGAASAIEPALARVALSASTNADGASVPVSLAAAFVPTPVQIAAAIADHSHWQCPTNNRICTKVRGRAGSLTVVAFGDSSIGSIDVGLIEWARRVGVTYVLAASGGCDASGQPRTQSTTQVVLGPMDAKCQSRYATIVNQVAALPAPLLVLVSDVSEYRSIVLPNGSIAVFGTSAHRQAVEAGLDAFVRRLNRRGVTVVLMKPAGHTLKPECVTATSSGTCALARLASDWAAQAQVASMFADVAARHPKLVRLVALGDIVCPSGGPCSSWHGSTLLRWDGIHYTRPGSRLVVAALIPRLRTAGVALPR